MNNITKHFILTLIALSSLGLYEDITAAPVTYGSTRRSGNRSVRRRNQPVRRRVVYRRGSRAGSVLAPTVTGAAIGGIAGGRRGAGIGAGVGLGLGLLNSRPRREVVYEYDDYNDSEVIDDDGEDFEVDE